MFYSYDQRKRPQGPQNTASEHTTAPGPGFSAPNPGASIPPAGPSFDLDAAMRERMASTFGDLSAVRDYTPPARTEAPPADRAVYRPRHPRHFQRLPLPFCGGTHAGQEGRQRTCTKMEGLGCCSAE